MSVTVSTKALIDQLVRSTGARDPFEAIRIKARGAIELYREAFGGPEIPLNVNALVSLLGIHWSEEPPAYSDDAELVPEGDGRVSIRVNPDRPETRIRFSAAHEVSHTFFPDYHRKVWCRTDARHRRQYAADDLLETLCDVGAAELLLPTPWFAEDAKAVTTGAGLAELARKYAASREATLRRFAETHPGCVAAVFLSWKLKPTEKRTVGRTDQTNIFGLDPESLARGAMQLRLDYGIPSPAFASAGHFLPKDKSVEMDGPFARAARGECADGDLRLNFGGSSGTFRVHAVPLYTPRGERGPGGEVSVAAILEPLDVRAPKKKSVAPSGPSLFD